MFQFVDNPENFGNEYIIPKLLFDNGSIPITVKALLL